MLEFEWCTEKERLIAEKHGLDIEKVKQIFEDPFRIVQYDIEHSGLENRWQILGKVNGILFAVYTERDEKIRIVTARKATSKERRIYYGKSKKGFWFIP
ncbi:MAG: BrnT family toxin [Treponema sp.]|nr:BrnT family toxin [Treponema sp.]